LSDVVPGALKLLPDAVKLRLRVSQQARKEDFSRVMAAYEGSGITIEVRPFFDDVPARLADAQILVCRAGGSTTAELTVSGRPAILVPYAAALADEQTANAGCLVDRGAAWMLSEREFTPAGLSGLLGRLLADPAALARAAVEAHAIGRPQAAKALADLVEEIEAEGSA
jgi:UDP-N-acetylglucosamine--N-acetylmuramyl-(pentapeptide) pyrophosphoryl-undecaprenol N-acetylglucosamine transferase